MKVDAEFTITSCFECTATKYDGRDLGGWKPSPYCYGKTTVLTILYEGFRGSLIKMFDKFGQAYSQCGEDIWIPQELGKGVSVDAYIDDYGSDTTEIKIKIGHIKWQ